MKTLESKEISVFLVGSQTMAAESSKGKRTRKQTVPWTREETNRLVVAVEAKPLLWDHTAAVYKDRDKRDMAWSNIATALKKPAGDCTQKWNNLRVNYRVNEMPICLIIIK